MFPRRIFLRIVFPPAIIVHRSLPSLGCFKFVTVCEGRHATGMLI